jgi:hypothetical protein
MVHGLNRRKHCAPDPRYEQTAGRTIERNKQDLDELGHDFGFDSSILPSLTEHSKQAKFPGEVCASCVVTIFGTLENAPKDLRYRLQTLSLSGEEKIAVRQYYYSISI